MRLKVSTFIINHLIGGQCQALFPATRHFQKKLIGKPNAKKAEEKHGKAYPSLLGLKPELLKEHEKIQMVKGFVLASSEGKGRKTAIPWIVKRQKGSGKIAAAQAKFEAITSSKAHIPEYQFCTALPTESGVKSTLFCLIKKSNEWLVYWVS